MHLPFVHMLKHMGLSYDSTVSSSQSLSLMANRETFSDDDGVAVRGEGISACPVVS